MTRVHRLLSYVLILGLILVIAGCGNKGVATTTSTATTVKTTVAPVRIGVLESTTGPVAPFGTAYLEAAKVAVQMVNDAGGIKSLGGAKVVMVLGNGDGTAPTATSEVERLINNEHVIAISGPTATAEALASIPLFERYKIPAVTILSDETQYQKGYRYIFGTNASVQQVGKKQADFIDYLAKKYGAPTDRIAVAALSPALTAKADAAVARLAQLGYKNVVSNESFPINVTDQGPLVLKMKNANPTLVIYEGAAADGVLFLKACETYDFHPWLIMDETAYGSSVVKDGLGSELAKKVLTRANIFGIGNGSSVELYDKVPSLKAFQDAFTKMFPASTSPRPTVAAGGLKMLALIRAIDNAGSTNPDAIAAALRKLDIKAPDSYLTFGDAYPEFKISDSGLAADSNIMAEQWATDMSAQHVVWPESVASTQPRVKK